MVIPFLMLIGKSLKKIPFLRKFVDERFLSYRRRAQRAAGLTGFLVADALFGYRYFVNHIFSWDLLAIVLSITVVYLVLIVRYLIEE